MENKTMKPSKILLPKVDVVFKLLFGDNRNKEILIDFLQAVLNISPEEYESINLVDPHLKKESIDDKLGIVDVRLTTKNGKTIHIEMQVVEQDEMPERITYYNSKMLVSQLKEGYGYDTLQKTISIVIADFDMIKESEKYHNIFQLREMTTGVKFTDIMEINTLELNKIPSTTDNTEKYNWLKFLKAEKEVEFEMIAKSNPVIEKAYDELQKISQDEDNQMLYEARQKAIRDEDARLRTFYNKGIKEGINETTIKIAKNFLNAGLSVKEVSKGTGLSIEEIEKLKTIK